MSILNGGKGDYIENRKRDNRFIKLVADWSIALAVLCGAGIALQYLCGYPVGFAGGAGLLAAPLIAGLLAALIIRKASEWERAVILRLGKFHRVKGPGLFLMIPFVDRIAETIDLRIRVSDFTAETTLSRDSVTVTVDALCFWLVWDAEKAVCEVQDYEDAVILSCKTALRSAVSKHDLSTFLEENNTIENTLREEVDAKTTDWGITVQHVEITDIQIPEQLQDAMSKLAQAEREKRGRILLAEAEIEIARKFEEAARIYSKDGTALNLKHLSILNEGLKAGNSMMLVPNSITERLEGKDIFGLEALGEIRRHAEKESGRRGEKADVRKGIKEK